MNFHLFDTLECVCGAQQLALKEAVTAKAANPETIREVPCKRVCGYRQCSIASGLITLADCQQCRSLEIQGGAISCNCGLEWPIVNGVPQFSGNHAPFDANGLRVVEVDSRTDPRWIHFIRAHPNATIYHHPLWLQVLNHEYAQPQLALACEDADGQLYGVLPLAYTRGLPASIGGCRTKRRLSSLPRTPVAGPLSIDGSSAEALLWTVVALAQKDPLVQLELKTQSPAYQTLGARMAGVPWRQSYVLPLPANVTDLRLGRSSKHRHRIKNSVKKAMEWGLQIRPAESEDELFRWYQLYLDTMKRKIVPPRPFRFFLGMWRLLHPRGLMQLLLAEKERIAGREVMAGSIFLEFGGTVSYAFTGCPRQNFALRPHDLIQWHAIHNAVERGNQRYDFGEVPDDSQSLARFKSKWGAEEQKLYRFYWPPPENLDCCSLPVGNWSKRLVRRVWSHLSLSTTAQLGDRIYRYL